MAQNHYEVSLPKTDPSLETPPKEDSKISLDADLKSPASTSQGSHGVSLKSVEKELAQLRSALKIDTDADATEIAFTYLYIHRESLSTEDLQTFAELSHAYMRRALPSRSVIQHLRQQHPKSGQIVWTRTLLEHYAQLAQTVQQRLTRELWLDFCAQAGQILFDIGYYQPEAMACTADTSDSPVALTPPPMNITQHHLASDTKETKDPSETKQAMASKSDSVCLYLHSTDISTSAWQYWHTGWLLSGQEKIWQERLDRLQIAGSHQLQMDYWAAKCYGRLEKLLKTATPVFADIDALRQDVATWLAVPGWTDAERQVLWERLRPVWPAETATDLSGQALERTIATGGDTLQSLQSWIQASETAMACYRIPHNSLGGMSPSVEMLTAESPSSDHSPIGERAESEVELTPDNSFTSVFEEKVPRVDEHTEVGTSSSTPPSFIPLFPQGEKEVLTDEREESKRAELKQAPPLTTEPPTDPLLSLIRTTEHDLGQPPCGFYVVQCRVIVTTDVAQPHAAYPTVEDGPLAILLTDPTTQYHPYWRTYTQLLQWRRQCQNPALFSKTSTHAWVASPEDLARTALVADPLGSSQTQAQAATALLPSYQKAVIAHLQTSSSETVPYARAYSYHGLQTLFNGSLSALDLMSPAVILLRPLTTFCLHLGLYAGLSPATLASPQTILAALAKTEHFSAACIVDLQQALVWAQAHQTVAPDRLTSAEQLQLQQYYKYTVYPLWHLCRHEDGVDPIWDLTRGPTPHFDPLLALFDKTRLACKYRCFATDLSESPLDFLAAVIVRRQLFFWEDQERYYWDIPLESRGAYVKALARVLPSEQQSLVARLRHLPNVSGWRLEQEEEQQAWETALQCLWQSPDKEKAPKGDEALLLPQGEKEILTPDPASEKDALKTSRSYPIYLSRLRSVPGIKRPKWILDQHTLDPSIAAQLFDSNGQWLPKNSGHGGNHRVFPIIIDRELRFWVKVYPEQMEHLVTMLDRRLGINGTPTLELVKFHHGFYRTSAAVITAAVNGTCLHPIVYKYPARLDELPLSVFVANLLRVLLTNPGDDKADDYFLTAGCKLMRIDNDRAFFQPTLINQRLGLKSEQLMVSSVLYCLEHMQWEWGDDPEVAAVVDDFLRLQPIAVISAMLTEADHLHDGLNLLFHEGEVDEHFNCHDPWASLPLLCIPQGWAKELITRFTAMSTALRMGHTHMTGLQLLRATQPKLAHYYSEAHQKVIAEPSSTLPEDKETKAVKKETKSDAPLRTRQHGIVAKRFEHVTGTLYKKDSRGRLQSQIPNSVAIQSSLRIESPIDYKMLHEIRAKRACSAKQALEQFQQWQETRLERLLGDLLRRRPEAVAEFRGLPLRHQELLWETLQKRTLNLEQQRFILKAMAGIAWPQLDLRRFAESLTDALLEPLLKGAGEQLLSLNISGCTQLTVKTLAMVARHNSQLQTLAARRMPWRQIVITEFMQLQRLDLGGSLVETLVVQAPQLWELQLNYCEQLRTMGAKGMLVNQPFQAPRLQHLGFTGCQATHLIVDEGESYNCFVEWLWCCSSITELEIQTSEGLIKVPNSLMGDMKRQIKKKRIRASVTDSVEKLGIMFSVLRRDRYFTGLDLRLAILAFRGSYLYSANLQALVEGFKTNTSLTDLTIDCDSSLGDRTVDELAKVLTKIFKTNTGLMHLVIYTDCIRDVNIQVLNKAMVKILETNTTLVRFKFFSKQITHRIHEHGHDLREYRSDDYDGYMRSNGYIEMRTPVEISRYLNRNRNLKVQCSAKVKDVGIAQPIKIQSRISHSTIEAEEKKNMLPQALFVSPKGSLPSSSFPSKYVAKPVDASSSSKLMPTVLSLPLTHMPLSISNPSLRGIVKAEPTQHPSKAKDAKIIQPIIIPVETTPPTVEVDEQSSASSSALPITPQEALYSSPPVVDIFEPADLISPTSRPTPALLSRLIPTPLNQVGGSSRNLENTRINSESAQKLAATLKTDTTLTHLDVSRNPYMGDGGAQAFARMLESNTTLKSVSLSKCGIGDDGVKALATMLKVNTTLLSIDLSRNHRMTEASAQMLAKVFETNTTLIDLDLDFNFSGVEEISTTCKQALADIERSLKRNRELRAQCPAEVAEAKVVKAKVVQPITIMRRKPSLTIEVTKGGEVVTNKNLLSAFFAKQRAAASSSSSSSKDVSKGVEVSSSVPAATSSHPTATSPSAFGYGRFLSAPPAQRSDVASKGIDMTTKYLVKRLRHKVYLLIKELYPPTTQKKLEHQDHYMEKLRKTTKLDGVKKLLEKLESRKERRQQYESYNPWR